MPQTQTAIECMISAQDAKLVWEVFADAVAGLGFDNLIYGGTRLPQNDRFGDIWDALILHRGPAAYADIYLGEELYLHSPTCDWAARNSGFASWPEAMRQYAGTPRPEHMRMAIRSTR